MANYSISATSLTEGRNVFIRGKLGFARLTRLIEGAELAASDQRKVQNGMSPVRKPHTTATITEAEVTLADAANPTVEEQFVSERRYTSKKKPDTGLNYSIDSKGNGLPAILIPSEKGNGTYDQDSSGQELAPGLDVTLVLRTFKPKNFSNRGLALEQVIVHEPPRYYNAGGVDADELAARGIVLNAPVRPVQAQSGAGSAVGTANGGAGTEIENGLSFPTPQSATPVATHTQATSVSAASESAVSELPQSQGETLEEKLERLEAENAQLKNADSAVGVSVPANQSPWDDHSEPQAGITYQG